MRAVKIEKSYKQAASAVLKTGLSICALGFAVNASAVPSVQHTEYKDADASTYTGRHGGSRLGGEIAINGGEQSLTAFSVATAAPPRLLAPPVVSSASASPTPQLSKPDVILAAPVVPTVATVIAAVTPAVVMPAVTTPAAPTADPAPTLITTAAIPEPGTIALLGLGALALLRRRKSI